ncbi:MAG TPA: hypothetical protein VLN74_09435 [Ilumatobacteraceae bacterium]|nr:hypothetical protein [Ilumatobacteraceae bacterium]
MTSQQSAQLRSRAFLTGALGVIAWGVVALVVYLSGVGGLPGGVLAMSFALLGPGVALVIALGESVVGALRVTILIGFGLAACTVIGQLLIIIGQYSPSAVIGIELAAALLILGVRGLRILKVRQVRS